MYNLDFSNHYHTYKTSVDNIYKVFTLIVNCTIQPFIHINIGQFMLLTYVCINISVTGYIIWMVFVIDFKIRKSREKSIYC